MTSHLTESELSALSSSGLSTKAPYIIRGASRSQFSIARHYGGCHAYGYSYTYIPATDELIRFDVVKALALIWRKACASAGEPHIELYAGLKHSSMSQYINEKGLMLAELQMISGHAKMDSVKKYADVGLERIRELMETEPAEAERLRKVK